MSFEMIYFRPVSESKSYSLPLVAWAMYYYIIASDTL